MMEVPAESAHFGACPECGGNDGYLNVGRDHWFVCHHHKVKWLVGTNLFSSWRYQEEDEWRENERLLAGYEEVLPV